MACSGCQKRREVMAEATRAALTGDRQTALERLREARESLADDGRSALTRIQDRMARAMGRRYHRL